MAEQTLDNLVAAIARRYGYYATGNANAGTTTTLTDTTNLIQPDNLWVNYYLHLLSGANVGEERLITAFSAGVLTFAALSSAVAEGLSYELTPLQRADYVNAIQGAIDRAGKNWMQVVDDETGTFTLGVQEYDLPVNAVSVLGVYIWTVPNASANGRWEALTNYEVLGVPGARTLVMRGWGEYPAVQSDTVNYLKRIRYLALPTRLATGTDTLGMGEVAERKALAFVQEYALHLLHEAAFSRNVTGEAARAHLSLSQQHQNKALQIMAEREAIREVRYMRGPHMSRQV